MEREKFHLLNIKICIKRGEVPERVERTGIQNRSGWIGYEKVLYLGEKM